MKLQPRIKHNICVNADPAGCAAQVAEQVAYIEGKPRVRGPGRALIIGCSNGYGLAARIAAAFGCGAATVGVYLEKAGTETKAGSAGWYNNIAFERVALARALPSASLNADAFSSETKAQTLELVRSTLRQVDLIVYSIAAPRRTDPVSGEIYSTTVKPIGQPFVGNTVDIRTGEIKRVEAQPASEQEIAETIKVMGGEDWMLWIEALVRADLLAPGASTVALSYIGPELTAPIYRSGTIGRAKENLERTAATIGERFADQRIQAAVSINKALVTRASAVIPAVTLYISLLYSVMKRKGLHEKCIHQMYRLFHDHLYSDDPVPRDEQGRIRLDDWELREDVQAEVAELWRAIEQGDVSSIADIDHFRQEFLEHHGFGMLPDDGAGAEPPS